jgi:hypothetical protein
MDYSDSGGDSISHIQIFYMDAGFTCSFCYKFLCPSAINLNKIWLHTLSSKG